MASRVPAQHPTGAPPGRRSHGLLNVDARVAVVVLDSEASSVCSAALKRVAAERSARSRGITPSATAIDDTGITSPAARRRRGALLWPRGAWPPGLGAVRHLRVPRTERWRGRISRGILVEALAERGRPVLPATRRRLESDGLSHKRLPANLQLHRLPAQLGTPVRGVGRRAQVGMPSRARDSSTLSGVSQRAATFAVAVLANVAFGDDIDGGGAEDRSCRCLLLPPLDCGELGSRRYGVPPFDVKLSALDR